MMAVTASPLKDGAKGYRRTYLLEPAASSDRTYLYDPVAAEAKQAGALSRLEVFEQLQLLVEWKRSILEMARGRRGAAPPGHARELRSDAEVAREDVKQTKQFRRDALNVLPAFFRKLTSVYEYRVFWFEVRVGMPAGCARLA